METLEGLLARHPFFEDLPEPDLKLIAGCGRNVAFREGQTVFREGEAANEFYLLREGVIRIEINSPRLGPITIQTVHAGEVLGWSWLFPPYRWHFDAHVMEAGRGTCLNGKCLREKLERDPQLGFALMKRFNGILLQRLQSTRLQLIEAYEGATEK